MATLWELTRRVLVVLLVCGFVAAWGVAIAYDYYDLHEIGWAP